MARLVLIRHGQASYGQADYDRLSPTRRASRRACSARTSRRSRLDALFVGPLRRQQQTAAFAAEAARPAALPRGRRRCDRARRVSGVRSRSRSSCRSSSPRIRRSPRCRPRRRASSPTARSTRILGTRGAATSGRSRASSASTEFAARVRERARARDATARPAPVGVVTSAGPIGVAVGLVFGVDEHRMVRTSVVVRNASISELVYRTQDVRVASRAGVAVTFNSDAPPARRAAHGVLSRHGLRSSRVGAAVARQDRAVRRRSRDARRGRARARLRRGGAELRPLRARCKAEGLWGPQIAEGARRARARRSSSTAW